MVMPDTDDVKRAGQDAAYTAAQVLDGLARLLRSDDPHMPDPEQRERKAEMFGSVANDLLAAHGLDHQAFLASEEWTANLSYLLGIIRRQHVADVRREV
jgi:hypothetical protein